ncbi:hypothetical protein FPT84_25080 [Salmonella enterica]|uniref:Uncharacterized protein n=2 Tax=Salmonella enterica I TaxID=59201 RepID=A0A5U3G627_SALET|nr:hypothetical protein [Salmonella enterica]EBH9884140.1 hypothetical protein [Salmonella enterica subsp. enterica serovar Kisarawe]EBP4061021.1 hypothetical protein [Salmonella enterica subsp. enterica]AXD45367.1 hypothetical protein CHD70_25620 [Salmonella enterica]EAA7570996.1 hypothetical protein [Salmonella enterica]EAS5879195.1 hypothetical protein [Salmonella enterica]
MIDCAIQLDSYVNVHNVARMVDLASAPFVRSSNAGKALSGTEAMRIIAEATADIRWYEAFFDGMVEVLPPSDEELTALPEAESRRLYKRYSDVAEFLTIHLRQLRIMVTMAECMPAWKPHASVLRTYSKQLFRAFAAIRNVYEDTAKALRQEFEHKPVDTVFGSDDTSLQEAISISHNTLGLRY